MNQNDVERVVRAVIQSMQSSATETVSARGGKLSAGVFHEVDDAVAEAHGAERALRTVAMRRLTVEAIRKAGEQHARELA